ncbi:MAG: LamG-like jellyroll fold domain-containing protein [Limisphaerales bacterium]
MKQLLRIALLLSLLATQTHNALGQSTLADGLVAYYPFNGNANDASGNGNNGTVFEAALSADRFGLASRAYAFDGVNDQITVAHSASISPTNEVTVAAWIRPMANEDNKHCVSKGSHVNYFSRSYSLQGPWADGKWRAALSTPTGEIVVASSSDAALGVWSHVLMSYDGAIVKLYVNGQLSGTQAATGLITQTSEPLLIGSHKFYAASDYWFNGGIDDVRIYNRAFSAAEVALLHASETAAPVITTQPTSASANVGGTATFIVTAAGSNPLSYQWRKDGVPVPGATNASYALFNVQTNQAGSYSVVITNVADDIIVTTYNATGLVAGAHEYKVAGRNSRGTGPESDVSVVNVA